MSVLIGLDVGTSGLKALAVDASDGSVIATATRGYPLETPRPGWAEQNPADFTRAAREALGQLAHASGPRRGEVRAIGLTGQMHSAVLLDARGDVVRPAILWCDTRTERECREITAALGHDGLRRTARNLALEGFTLPKLLWLRRHEPEAWARVRTVLMPKDFVGRDLTGVLGTEVSDASGTLAFDPGARRWSHEVLAAMGVDASVFPPVGESIDLLGELSPEAAAATGLRAGIPVIRGAADNAAGAVGLGVVRAGRAMASIGTSGVVLAHTDTLRVEPAMKLHSFCAAIPGRSYVMGVMLSAGGSLRWFRDTIAGGSYDEITAAASRASRGARGLLFLPYLMGERTPHNDASARGAFVGLSAATGRDEMARAVLEGISFGLADSLALMRALDPPMPFTEIRLTGGGARSAFWRQLLADVFGVPVTLTSSTEGPAYGAAILAGAGIGALASVEQGADAWVRETARVEPHPEGYEFYRALAAEYAGLYGDLRARFERLARIAG